MDTELVRSVARIARLSLSDAEERQFAEDLENILTAFKTLNEADVHGVEPTIHPVAVENRTRSDAVKPSLSRKDALANAAHTENGYFVGPKVL